MYKKILNNFNFYQKVLWGLIIFAILTGCCLSDKSFDKNNYIIFEPVSISYMKYILDDLKANGNVTFLICAADNGVNTTNACGHTTLPTQETVDKASETYDSLYFSFHGAKALFILNPARIIPLYIVSIQGN